MPEEQRMREDMEYAEATRAREKGDMAFLQKYYHKGAFHQVSPWSGQLGLSADLRRTRSCSSGITPPRRRAKWTCRCCPSSCRSGTSARSVKLRSSGRAWLICSDVEDQVHPSRRPGYQSRWLGHSRKTDWRYRYRGHWHDHHRMLEL